MNEFLIRYDSVYLTCSKQLTDSQLSLPHETNKHSKRKTTNKLMSMIRMRKQVTASRPTIALYRNSPLPVIMNQLFTSVKLLSKIIYLPNSQGNKNGDLTLDNCKQYASIRSSAVAEMLCHCKVTQCHSRSLKMLLYHSKASVRFAIQLS